MSNLKNGHRERQMKREHKARCRAVSAPCHLCNQPIRYDAPARHPEAFESDHRYPVKTHPQHAYDINLLLPSHSKCNRSRGANALPTGDWVAADW